MQFSSADPDEAEAARRLSVEIMAPPSPKQREPDSPTVRRAEEFKQKRLEHYNEGMLLKQARLLLAKDLEDEEDDDDSDDGQVLTPKYSIDYSR